MGYKIDGLNLYIEGWRYIVFNDYNEMNIKDSLEDAEEERCQ
jgi:hypothetical protein